MKQPFQLSLRAGEKIYINGAVLRVDRKVTLELLNDVTFLLENHVLQPDEAITPLRQLYFVVQTMLMEPEGQEAKFSFFQEFRDAAHGAFEDVNVLSQLHEVDHLMEECRHFEALKLIRKLFPMEDEMLADDVSDSSSIPQMQRSTKDGSYAA